MFAGPVARRALLGLALAAPAASLRTSGRSAAAEGADGDYYWPSGHGRNGDYGNSPYAGPRNLPAAFAWSWHHPEGRFHTLPYGTAIDHEKNIYLTTDTSVWKISPSGTAVWSFYPNLKPKGAIFGAGSLHNGKIFFSTTNGIVYAVDMESGKEAWSKKVCDKSNYDNRFVGAHEGVVVAATNLVDGEDKIVRALNATDGAPLWTYKTQVGLWNFEPLFPGDGSVVYQDREGRAYRNSFTDGSPLYHNGTLYTVTAWMERGEGDGHNAPGRLRAYRLEDGKLLWDAPVAMPPNNAPAIGRLPGHTGLSIIQPAGYQGVKHGKTAVYAYDAATGNRQWSHYGPVQKHDRQAGVLEGLVERMGAGATPGYVTNPWSAAVIDAEGTIYLGHEDGLFFAMNDANGDGVLSGESEVSIFDTGAAFVGSSSPALAPGMLAVASCDTLYVFNV